MGEKINVKMNNKSIMKFSIIAGILIIIVSVVSFILIRDLKQESILKTEISNLAKQDFENANFNTNIKSTKNYAVVEKSIKEYLDEYSTNLKELLKIADDEKLVNILSADNYSKDGPDFKETKEYLSTTKTSFNEKLNRLTQMTTEEEIMNKIEEKKLDKTYVDLYKKLMLGETKKVDFSESQETYKQIGENINNILTTEEKVIDLLISNKNKWQIEDGKIVFQNTDTLNKYNELIKEYQSE